MAENEQEAPSQVSDPFAPFYSSESGDSPRSENGRQSKAQPWASKTQADNPFVQFYASTPAEIDLGPQKSPSSVSKVKAETSQARTEAAESLAAVSEAAAQAKEEGRAFLLPTAEDRARRAEGERLFKAALDAGASGDHASKIRTAAAQGIPIERYGDLPVLNEDIERVAAENGVTPSTIRKSGTMLGRFQSRIAKSVVGQGVLSAEAGARDVASTIVSLSSRLGLLDESISSRVHTAKQLKDEYLQFAEKGGQVDQALGPTGSQIYSGAVRSLTSVGLTAPLGPVGIYSGIMGQTFDDELERSGDAGHAAKMAAVEGGITFLFGRTAKKFGLDSLEEFMSPAVRRSTGKIASRLGLRAAGGTAVEAAEEATVDLAQQALFMARETAEGRSAEFNPAQTFIAAATGGVARGLAGGLSQTTRTVAGALKKNKNFVRQTIDGTLAAEKLLKGEGGDLAANTIVANPPTNAKEFADATGIKRAKPAFREAFLDTFSVYAPASEGVGTDPQTITTPGEISTQETTAETETAVKDAQAIGERRARALSTDKTVDVPERADNSPPDPWNLSKDEYLNHTVETYGGGTQALSPLEAQTLRQSSQHKKFKLTNPRVEDDARGVGTQYPYNGPIGKTVTLYRAVANDVEIIEPGQYITLSQEYAQSHLDAHITGRYVENPALTRGGHILSIEVPAEDVVVMANNELAWVPQDAYAAMQEQAAKRKTAGDMSLLSEQRADEVEPPPPAVHDTFVTDQQGAMVVPEQVQQSFAAEVGRHVRSARDAFLNIHLSMIDSLQSQASRAPAHQKKAAKQMADFLKETGENVLHAERSIAREIGVEHDRLQRDAGRPSFLAASIEAQQDGRTFTTRNGATGIEAKWVGAVEQKNDAPIKSRRLRKWLDGFVDYMDKRGQSAERRKVRRAVPQNQLGRRLAALGQMSDSQLKAEHSALFPNDKEVESRGQLIEKLQSVEFFTNPGGNVVPRMPTDVVQQIKALGPGDPRYQDFVEIVAEWNNATVEDVDRDFTELRTSSEKKTAIEFARIYPNMPTAMVGRDGKRWQLFEAHPFRHLARSHDSFARRMGNLEVIGDKWAPRIPLQTLGIEGSLTDRVPPVDKLSNAAKQTGLNPTTVDAFLNGLAGHSLSRNIGTDQGGERASNRNIFTALLSTTLAGNMSLSGVTTLAETLGDVRAFGGSRRLLQAWAEQLKRDPRAAQADLIRAGALAKDYGNFTLDAEHPITSTIGAAGEVLLTGTRPVWNQQSRDAAHVGTILADDFKNGRASKWDRDTLSRWLGYSKDEAEAIYDRTAPPEAYEEMAQRFAARTIASKLTSPIEESQFRAHPILRALYPLTRYTLQKARDTWQLVKNLAQDHVEFASTRSPESGARLARGWLEAGLYLGGVGLSGAFANLARSMFYYGFEEGLGLEIERWQHAPVEATADSLVSGNLGFLLGNLYWGAQRANEQFGLLEMTGSATAGIVGEAYSLGYSMFVAYPQGQLGHGRYTKLDGPVDMAAAYVEATVPAARAINTTASHTREYVPAARIILPAALGMQDRKLDVAWIAMFRFLDGKDRGPGSGRVGGVDDGTAEFIRQMNNFSREIGKVEPLSDERVSQARDYLLAAIGTDSKEPQQIAQSARGRKALNLFQGRDAAILEREFAEKFPHHYEKLLKHDAVVDAWADVIYQPKR